MTDELKPCPLTWAIQRLNSTPYSLTKDECVDVLRGLRDEIRALAAAQPAQAGEVDAKCQTCNGHGLVGGHMQDGSGYGEGCPDCNPEPAPLVKWASTQPAAQATPEPGWDSPLSDFQEGQWWVRELDAMAQKPDATADQKRAVAVVHHMLRAASKATPEPVGEPGRAFYDATCFAFDVRTDWGSLPETIKHRYALAAAKLTHPAPGVPDDVQREIAAALALFPINISAQSFVVNGVNEGRRLEADGDTYFFSQQKVIALLEKLHTHLAAAQAKGGGHAR